MLAHYRAESPLPMVRFVEKMGEGESPLLVLLLYQMQHMTITMQMMCKELELDAVGHFVTDVAPPKGN
jgi:hypothetical protein